MSQAAWQVADTRVLPLQDAGHAPSCNSSAGGGPAHTAVGKIDRQQDEY